MFAHTRRLGAYPAFLIYEGGSALTFSLVVTVNLVWQAQAAGLNPLQLVLVGTVLELTCMLAEVPTGIVADVYSRRLSIVIGLVLMGAGFMVEGSFPRFEPILLAEVIWGIGATFLSGAVQAWISDEIGEHAATGAFMRGAQVAQVGTFVAIPISVALAASMSLNAPILLGAGLMIVLGLALAFVMPETGFVRAAASTRGTFGSMAHTLGDSARVVRGSPLLITLLLLAAFFGLASEGWDRLSTPHLLQNLEFPSLFGLEPITWFGVMRGGAMLLAIAATELVRRWLNTSDGRAVAQALFVGDALRIGCTIVFALTGDFFVAVAASWGVSVLRQVNRPVYIAWLNRQLESRSRATVLSMSGQIDALGQIVGGPAVGVLATTSIRAALVVTAALLAPALLLYARARGQTADAALTPVSP